MHCASLSSKQAVGLCQKREDSLSVSAASGWAVNFYSRIHFQYPHISLQICKVSHFSNLVPTYPRFHLLNWNCVPWDWFAERPGERPEALLFPASGIYFCLSTQSAKSSCIWRRKNHNFANLIDCAVCTNHSLQRAKREIICKIFIHKQLRFGLVSMNISNSTFWQSSFEIQIIWFHFQKVNSECQGEEKNALTQNQWKDR